MADYKVVNATQLDTDLTNIANSIRTNLEKAPTTKYYEVLLSFAEDDMDFTNPIFTKTNIELHFEGNEPENLLYNEAGTTTTGEVVYCFDPVTPRFCYILLNSEAPIDFQNFPDKINEVYEAARLYAAQQAQNFGNKQNYSYWKYQQDITGLKIPYPMAPTKATQMFSNTCTSDGSLIDLRNYDIDFSQCTKFDYFINISPVSAIGTLDTTACSDLPNLLYNGTYLETIEHLILKEDGSQKLGNDFGLLCKNLKYINKITGQFGSSFRIFHNSSVLMDHDTVINILNALKPYTGDPANAPVCTLYSNGWNAISEEEKLIATNKGWSLA